MIKNYFINSCFTLKKFVAIGVFSLLFSITLSAQIIFIDAVNGNDNTGNGSEATPFKTLSSVWDSLKGGETIKLYDGNYGPIYQNYYKGYITPNDWITIEAVDGYSPEIDSVQYVGFKTDNSFNDIHVAFLSLKGIHILNGINISSCKNIKIDSCFIERIGPWVGSVANIGKSGVKAIAAVNLSVKNSEITNSATGITVRGMNVQIINNKIHHLTHDGIQVVGCQNSLFEGNLIYNLDDGIEDGDADWNRHCDAIHVYIMGTASVEDAYPNKNIIFRGNTLYDCESQGLQFNVYHPEVLNKNLVFENNIFGPTRANRFNCLSNMVDTIIFRNNTFMPVEKGYSFTSRFREVQCDNRNTMRVEKDIVGLEIYNNILPTLPNVSDTQYCDYNLYYNMTATSPVSRNSIVDTNVQFLNPDSYDGKLSAASPAINAGTVLNAPSGIYEKDLYGTLRDKRPDIGAYELAGQSPQEEKTPPVFDDEKTIFVDDFSDANFLEDPWLQAENTQGLSWEEVQSFSGNFKVIKQTDFSGNCLSGPNPNGNALLFSEQGNNWADYTFEFDAYNAYVIENDGAVFLAKDSNNYYWLDISRDNGRLVRFMKVDGVQQVDTLERNESIQLPHKGIRKYKMDILHSENQILISVDADRDNSIDFSYTDSDTNAFKTFTCGKIGFKINHNNGHYRALYDNIKVEVSKLCETDSNTIPVENIAISKLKLYPNPANDFIILSGYTGKNISVLSIYGRTLLEKEVINNETQLDISNLPEGIYFVRINNQLKKFSVIK